MGNKNVKSSKIYSNKKDLSLVEYFSSLLKAVRTTVIISAPKEELIREIARICGKSNMTARRWVYGYVKPCLAEREKIAELINCSVESLFPTQNDNSQDG